jgi:hypothetical protein
MKSTKILDEQGRHLGVVQVKDLAAKFISNGHQGLSLVNINKIKTAMRREERIAYGEISGYSMIKNKEMLYALSTKPQKPIWFIGYKNRAYKHHWSKIVKMEAKKVDQLIDLGIVFYRKAGGGLK